MNVTKNFPKKDDDDKDLTWETALDVYPAFKKYCDLVLVKLPPRPKDGDYSRENIKRLIDSQK